MTSKHTPGPPTFLATSRSTSSPLGRKTEHEVPCKKSVSVSVSVGFKGVRSFYLLTYLNLPLSYAPVDGFGGRQLGGTVR
jgi:hypothetical protein